MQRAPPPLVLRSSSARPPPPPSYLLPLLWLLLATSAVAGPQKGVMCDVGVSHEANLMRPPEPLVVVQALRPAGIRIAVKDRPGTELVLFHANLNLPIKEDTQKGEISGIADKPEDGLWTIHLPEPVIELNDVIFYWIHMRINQQGYTYPTKITKITEYQKESCLPSLTLFNGKSTCKGELIFEENFNSLDNFSWKHNVHFPNINNPYFSIYTASLANSFVENGVLHIRPSQVPDDVVNGALTLEGCTGQEDTRECTRRANAWDVLPAVYSAWLRSNNTFRYGHLQVRAKLAAGDWLFNHIWLQRTESAEEGESETGRISLAVVRGNANLTTENGTAIGARRISPCVVLGYCYRKLTLANDRDMEEYGLWTDDFHVYGVTWSPEEIKFKVDDVSIYTLRPHEKGFTSMPFFADCQPHMRGKIAPLDKEMFLNIAVHVGGSTEFPTGSSSAGRLKPWNDKDPKANLQFWKEKNLWLPTWSLQKSAMKIDWVKLWAI